MNNEKQTADINQQVNSLSCEHLSDEAYCRFHCAVLTLVSAAVKEERLFIPRNLYCQYKGFVKLSCKTHRAMQIDEATEKPGMDLKEMYHCYRTQAEEHYRILCRLVVSAYQKATIPEERENLHKLIEGIRLVVEQTAFSEG